MKDPGDDSRTSNRSTRTHGHPAASRNRSGAAFPRLPFLWSLVLVATAAAPSTSFSQPAPPSVATSFRVYRAIDSSLLGGARGDAGTRLGNTNAGSAGGVLGYLHSEVVPSFAITKDGRRRNNIDAIAVFEVHVLNVKRAQLFGPGRSTEGANLFGPFIAFDNGLAMPPWARDKILSTGAYVGIQNQDHHARHAYPGDWYSFVGGCPMSEWALGENGRRAKPSPCPTTPALESICPASGEPDGTLQCQYTYRYLGYVPLDDLTGITSKDHPLCRTGDEPRACRDYADFASNGGIEYSPGPGDPIECADQTKPESGLPFWRGRCDPELALARIRALTSWSHLVTPASPASTPGVPTGGKSGSR